MADRSSTFGGSKYARARGVVIFSVVFWVAAGAVILAWRTALTLRFPAFGTWGTPAVYGGLLLAVIVARIVWRQEARRRTFPRGTVAVGHALLSLTALAGVALLLFGQPFWLGVGICLWIAEESWALGLWQASPPESLRSLVARKIIKPEPSEPPAAEVLQQAESHRADAAETVAHRAAATVESSRATSNANDAPDSSPAESCELPEGSGDACDPEGESAPEAGEEIGAEEQTEEMEEWEEQQGEEAAEEEEEEAAEEEAEDLPPPDVSQQWTRQRMPDGSDVLSAWHRLEFSPGQTHQTVHLPFWPAFESPPAVEAQIIEGPPGNVKVSGVWGFGARLEVRLAAPLDEPSEILILTVAQSSPDA
ncbi:hypothetical protein [Thermopirellula anaerolimosa]